MKKLILLLIISICAFSVFGQRTENRRINNQSATKENEFDLSLTKLPPNFRGNNFQSLLLEAVDRYLSPSQQKNEYETTTDFNARIQKLKNAPFRSGLNKDSLLAFVIDDRAVDKKYDADEQKLSFSLRVFRTTGCQTSSSDQYWWLCKSLQISSKHTVQGSYVAQNAFGARITVKKEHYMFMMLDLIGEEIPFVQGFYNFSVPVKTIDAPKLKDETRILAIGYLYEDNLTNANNEKQEPTRDNPVDIKTNYLNLNFKLRELWLFNSRTGYVYDKISRRTEN